MNININKKKKLAAKLSIISNVILTCLKIVVGVISGSLCVISEAIHSLCDCLASVLTFFSVLKSAKPADEDHPYGHGKYEDLSGFIEGLLIIFASLFIILESTKKIIFGNTMNSDNILCIIVMGIAVLVNILVSSYLFRVAKQSNSISLYADGEHLRTDVYSSLGVFIGLILIKITKHSILDPIIAILVAVVIYRAGYSITKTSFMRLVDHSLSDEDINKIAQIINSCGNSAILNKNSIKTRQVGPSTDIDFTLQFPEDTSICECHKVCDEIEKRIREVYINSSISIHSEPICYKVDCKTCSKNS